MNTKYYEKITESTLHSKEAGKHEMGSSAYSNKLE